MTGFQTACPFDLRCAFKRLSYRMSMLFVDTRETLIFLNVSLPGLSWKEADLASVDFFA